MHKLSSTSSITILVDCCNFKEVELKCLCLKLVIPQEAKY